MRLLGISIFLVHFSFFSAIAVSREDMLQAMSSPVFTLQENTRKKSLFSVDVGILHQLTSYDVDSPSKQVPVFANHQSLNGSGFRAQFVLNVTEKGWLKLYGEGVWLTSKGYTESFYWNIGNKGNNYEIQAVAGYDVLSYDHFDVSLYGGLFHKAMMVTDHINIKNVSGNEFSKTWNINYTGAVFGSSLSSYITENISSLIYIEGYLTASHGNYGYQDPSLVTNFLADAAVSGGFGFGGSFDIKFMKNLFLKPSIKYQMLFAGRPASEKEYGSLDFHALTLSLSLGWQ